MKLNNAPPLSFERRWFPSRPLRVDRSLTVVWVKMVWYGTVWEKGDTRWKQAPSLPSLALIYARVQVNDDVDSCNEDLGGDEYDNYM